MGNCKDCKHWDRDGVNYGNHYAEPIFPVHRCNGMASIFQLGADTDCWHGTPPSFGCTDFEEIRAASGDER